MKPESYYAWKEKPTSIIAPEWRAPACAPRRRGVMGAGRDRPIYTLASTLT